MKARLEYLVACGIVGLVSVVLLATVCVLQPAVWLLDWEKKKSK